MPTVSNHMPAQTTRFASISVASASMDCIKSKFTFAWYLSPNTIRGSSTNPSESLLLHGDHTRYLRPENIVFSGWFTSNRYTMATPLWRKYFGQLEGWNSLQLVSSRWYNFVAQLWIFFKRCGLHYNIQCSIYLDQVSKSYVLEYNPLPMIPLSRYINLVMISVNWCILVLISSVKCTCQYDHVAAFFTSIWRHQCSFQPFSYDVLLLFRFVQLVLLINVGFIRELFSFWFNYISIN